MNDFIAQILVLTAQVIVITAMLIQYLRIISTKTIKGLSGWTYTLLTGSTFAWGIYGIKQGIEAFYVTSFITTLIGFSILGHLYSVSKTRRRMEIYAVTVGLTLCALLIWFPVYAGWIGFLYTALARIPQYGHLLRDRNLKGISPLSHCIFIVANSITLIYANYYKMVPVTFSALLAIFSSVFLLFMVAKKYQVNGRTN